MPSSTFTSTYQNYLVTLNLTSSSTQQVVNCRVNSSGTPRTASEYKWGQQNMEVNGVQSVASAETTQLRINAFRGTTDLSNVNFLQVYQPTTSGEITTITSTGMGAVSDRWAFQTMGGFYYTKEAHDGLTFFVSGTFGGNYKVYGISNS